MSREHSEWHQGVLIQSNSSWHHLEEIGVMADAQAMILAGERSGAWPVHVALEAIYSGQDRIGPTVKFAEKGVVGTYADGSRLGLGVVGGRYQATTPEEWRGLATAVVAAGGMPTGAFSLREGRRVLATFQVGKENGLKTYMNLVDSFDGSIHLTAGDTSIRTICANTLAISMRQDGAGMARIRHTSSLSEKVKALETAIGQSIESGQKVRDTYHAAEAKRLTKEDVSDILDKLFPMPTGEKVTETAKTKATNKRAEMIVAMSREENNVGSSLATVWNGATWLVDRNADGSERKGKGGSDTLDSLLFGTRGERVQEIQNVIEVVLKDGTIGTMSIPEYTDKVMSEPGYAFTDFQRLIGMKAPEAKPID